MKVILASPIDAESRETLDATHDLVTAFDDFGIHRGDVLQDREVLVFRSGVDINRQLMELAPNLTLLVRAGSGFDNIDLDYARSQGMRVVRTPGPAAAAVAEFTFGLMLALSRHIVRADALVRNGSWPKSELGGNLLAGKVLGVVGAGNIGSRVGQLGAALGMTGLGCVAEADQPWNPPPEIEECELQAMLPRADYLTVHTPLTDTTRYLLGSAELASMKAGAFLINTARGGVVDEAALYDALASGHLGGAALDVHENEGEGVIPKLADLPNVVLTPHIAGMALESQRIIGQRILALIEAHAGGTLDSAATDAEVLV